MKWIKCSDRLPVISEHVHVTDGYKVIEGFAYDNEHGGIYFHLGCNDFLPIWWRPLKGGKLDTDLEEISFVPTPPTWEE